ncbi:MAG: carotenoid biosynthesis protein [Fimbriimonadaceae bacterium]|nr:carotenoid biosynthesis protein [Fimbriimonadaceae bacterium]
MKGHHETRKGRLVPKGVALRVFLATVAFSMLGTALASAGIAPPPGIESIANLVLILSGCLALVDWLRVPIFAWILVLTLGAMIEWVGLATGWPFGAYVYTGDWWPSIAGPSGSAFPVLLPFAWLMMAGAAYALARHWVGGWRAAALGGLLASVVDLLLEPVMVDRLGYWRWADSGPLPGGAPWSNFFAWYATAFLAGLILSRWDQSPKREKSVGAWILVPFSLFLAALYALSPSLADLPAPRDEDSSGDLVRRV